MVENSPLIKAIRTGDNRMVQYYINRRMFLTESDFDGYSPLHNAIQKKSLEMVGWLLESPDIDINCKDIEGNSPLHLAIISNLLPIVECLLQFQCDINTTNNFNRTPLHYAIAKSTFLVEVLLKRGADINCIDNSGRTPLHYAVSRNDLELVCMLLCYGADVTIQCVYGRTPFMNAVKRINRLEIAETLLDYYNDFSAVDHQGQNALFLAADVTSPLAVDIARAAGANCIPIGLEAELLFSSLSGYTTVVLFKEIWHKLDLDYISFADVLIRYLIGCSFPTNEWLQCLYDILESFTYWDLNESVDSCAGYSKLLFKCFYVKSVPLKDAIAMTTFLFSYGFQVCLCGFDIIYTLYGCKEEFEIMLNYLSFKECCFQYTFGLFPLISFIVGQDKGTDLRNIVPLFWNSLLETTDELCITFKEKNILKALEYFSFPYFARSTILSFPVNSSLKKKIKTKLEIIPEMPTLLELARNKIRNCIKRNCSYSQQHTFYHSVRKLILPNKLLDIILFKESLYK